jgi:hypothetical protein
MDDSRYSISPDALDADAAPIVIDMRRDAGFAGAAKPHAIRPDRDRTRAMNSQ